MDKKVVFLGGVFQSNLSSFILENSSGVVQNAADALQKKILVGLDSNLQDGVLVINLPFVGSYPRRFRVAAFPSSEESFGLRSTIRGIGFFNVALVKYFSRFFAAFHALRKTILNGRRTVVLVYSAHLPFVLAAVCLKIVRPKVDICLIVPDLPEYMGEGGWAYKIFKWVDKSVFYTLVRSVDYFVLLTKHMAVKLNVDIRKVAVIEGIASQDSGCLSAIPERGASGVRSFLYTGTLAGRYGIRDLIDAFVRIESDEVELWVCGEGDCREYVTEASIRDGRIKYFGQLERSEAVKLQAKATALINPRRPEGEFTKYSFPSKVMEYMASGRPVIMYKLESFPDEYAPHYIAPRSVGVEGLIECMNMVLRMKSDELNELGDAARSFVLSEKNPVVQSNKILNLIMEDS